MKSTGEVMGIDYDFGRAFYKASISAENEIPTEGNIFLSISDDQKDEFAPIARGFRHLGLNLFATAGTMDFLTMNGIDGQMLRKVQEGSPNVIDMIRRGEIRLIINTPVDKQSRQDHYQIMREAVDHGIPYITTVQAARAAVRAIEVIKKEKITLEPLHHYIGGT
jgi:carbamoyl-phosphate synthase large subunit